MKFKVAYCLELVGDEIIHAYSVTIRVKASLVQDDNRSCLIEVKVNTNHPSNEVSQGISQAQTLAKKGNNRKMINASLANGRLKKNREGGFLLYL